MIKIWHDIKDSILVALDDSNDIRQLKLKQRIRAFRRNYCLSLLGGQYLMENCIGGGGGGGGGEGKSMIRCIINCTVKKNRLVGIQFCPVTELFWRRVHMMRYVRTILLCSCTELKPKIHESVDLKRTACYKSYRVNQLQTKYIRYLKVSATVTFILIGVWRSKLQKIFKVSI